MADCARELEFNLRRRVSRLFDDTAKWKMPRAGVLDRLSKRSTPAFLFGGTVRDIMLRSAYFAFRDIDVVLQGVTTEYLRNEFSEFIARQTRFGGLHLDVKGWLFDVWPLEQTWAIREFPNLFSADPESLPRTTFLTTEAVAVSLSRRRGQARAVFENGFFEAISNKIVELNFDQTPFPALNVVRSLLTAQRLGFSIGPKLLRFIHDCSLTSKVDELIDIQRKHYGRVAISATKLERQLNEVSRWLRRHPLIAMPMILQRQRRFVWRSKDAQ